MRAFITRQAASVIGWTQGDEIMYGREFALSVAMRKSPCVARSRSPLVAS